MLLDNFQVHDLGGFIALTTGRTILAVVIYVGAPKPPNLYEFLF